MTAADLETTSVGVGVVGVEELSWPPPHGQPARARRWVHHVLHGLAVELDAACQAHDAVTALRATVGQAHATRGGLAGVLRGIAATAVPTHDSTDLTDLLTAHRLADAAGQLHTAHIRRRAAITLLRRLADLDDHGLVDRDQLPGLLDRVAGDLRAAGDALVAADRQLVTALTDHDPRR